MTKKRLSILIPTYNRCVHLEMLLETLAHELTGLEELVGVLVSDNGSTDSTSVVMARFAERMPNLRMIRHSQNLGMDENFCGCVEADDAEYFWLMGDDDLPRAGAVGYVLKLVAAQQPDLVYLESDWCAELKDHRPDDPVPNVSPLQLETLTFARRVNVWTTFISGMVVKRATFVDKATSQQLRRYNKTNLVQLSWILGTLAEGRKLLYIPEPCVLATSGNTGGYAVLKVFGEYFPSIVSQQFGADSLVARAVIRRTAFGYLPGLAWKVRTGGVGRFTAEQASAAIVRPDVAGALSCQIVRLISEWPLAFAFTTRVLCSMGAKAIRVHDLILESLGNRKRKLA
ncbi:MAG: glycosyltransferase [Rhodocyclaceae bacterium]